MTRDKLNELKKKVIDYKEACADMLKLANAFKSLPKGQLKKILTDEIKEIFKKYGVEF